MHPFVVAAAAIGISMLVIPIMWRLAPKLGMVDEPDPRKVHSAPVARVGGWGMVLGALIPLILWVPLDALMYCYLFGSLALLAFGSLDDCQDIGHWGKFIGQFLAVIPVVYVGDLYVERLPVMGLESLDPDIGKPFTVFAMVGMINAINHSDGLDGLAGGESLLSLTVIAMLSHLYDGGVALLIATATIGGVLGFLRFNTHPARVFMGDSGSQFLGFTLGFLAVLLTQRVNPALSPALPALFLGLPIMDILAVLVQRIAGGMNWFRATRNHIHHRLLDLGFEHYETVVIIYSIQTFFVISAVILQYEADWLVMAVYFGVCGALFALIYLAERRAWRAHGRGEGSRLSSLVQSVKRHPLFASGPTTLVDAAVPIYVVAGSVFVERVPRDFGMVATVLFAVLIIELLFSKSIGSVIVRGTIYVAATFVVYLTVNYPGPWVTLVQRVELGYFVVLAGAIWLSVRYSTGDAFNTTPMDYLIVFVVTTLGIFSRNFFSIHELGILVLKIMIVLYGCEVLINSMHRRWSGLSVGCLAALGILGLRGLFT